MSLGFRLNILITLLFALMLFLGAALVIHDARRTVFEEVQSTADLTLQLLEVALEGGRTFGPSQVRAELFKRIIQLEKTRRLQIEVLMPDSSSNDQIRVEREYAGSAAPGWFAFLVASGPFEFRHKLSIAAAPYSEIVIRADPTDEIRKVWEEARILLGLLLIFTVLANGVVFVTIRRALRPMEQIHTALDGIEQGDYGARLPQLKLPELQRLALKFNRMAQALEKETEENRYLSERSLAIQEEERRYLARELHDELGQSTTAIKALAASIDHDQAHGSTVEHERTQSIVSICNHIHEVLRGMMRRLRPIALDELGLVKALQQTVDEWNAYHHDVFCWFSAEGPLDQLSESVNIGVYRIVQECLTNIAKHAKSSEARIQLRCAEGPAEDEAQTLHLSVEDNGVGFEPNSVPQGLGSRGIRERVAALRGAVHVDSRPGEGVRIRITLPLASETIADDRTEESHSSLDGRRPRRGARGLPDAAQELS